MEQRNPTWGCPRIAEQVNSLWSLDLVRCESVALRTFWVVVVMDQWTRRIVGFGIQPGIVDGPALCRMFTVCGLLSPFWSNISF